MGTTCLPSRYVDETSADTKLDEVQHKTTRASQRQNQKLDAAKTSRLTANKRRYRARQKEYVADLERRLEEVRVQGVQATTQVQLAARKVVAENGRLRELLRLAGFADDDIDIWAKDEDGRSKADEAHCARKREIGWRARLCARLASDHEGSAMEGETTGSLRGNNSGRDSGMAVNTPQNTDAPFSANESVTANGSPSSPTESDAARITCPFSATNEAAAAVRTEIHTSHNGGIRPCQLLSLLAENPTADITQVTTHASSADPPQGAAAHGGDVECGKAYEMLMRYATSEEKMDYIARALETGCTSKGKGACAVKKEVVWEALDGICG